MNLAIKISLLSSGLRDWRTVDYYSGLYTNTIPGLTGERLERSKPCRKRTDN